MFNSKGASADESFKVGWPLPPFFYKEYLKSPDEGRPPPIANLKTWKQYGVVYQEDFHIEPLASDVLMYSTDADVDLREEFRSLFFQYAEAMGTLTDNLANQRGDDASRIKNVIKIYKNLLHILLRLRRTQAEEEVINRLRCQLKRRRKSIDALKRSLAAVWNELHSLSGETTES